MSFFVVYLFQTPVFFADLLLPTTRFLFFLFNFLDFDAEVLPKSISSCGESYRPNHTMFAEEGFLYAHAVYRYVLVAIARSGLDYARGGNAVED